MQILAVISKGEYGQRHVANIRRYAPQSWLINVWHAPAVLPLMIDYPEEYVPETLPAADLILSFAEYKGVAELLPDVARVTGAQAVIAAIDNEACLPRGLARQLRGWLQDMNVACVTPKPLCTLTTSHYGTARRRRIAYDNPLVAEFATYFGQPELKLAIDPQSRKITGAEVLRDTVCGCARHVAQGLVGVSANNAEHQAGMLHHHFPCLASMGIDADYGDTLMHISGNILKDNVGEQVKPFKHVQTIIPKDKSE